MDITVRTEQPKDHKIVEEIAREAFWNLYFPGCHEHFVIHQMRNHPDFIPELAFVVEADDQVVGSIFYTQSKVVSADGTEHPTITFGPVSIMPGRHRQGLGRAMISHSIEEAKKMGYRAILTLGYPYHYEPYGFLGGKNYGISMADGKFYKGLLVLPLYEGALDGISGYAVFSDVFEQDEEEIEKFDQEFAYKEKEVMECQREFEIAASMLDE